MKTDDIENDVRLALTQRAAEIPGTASDRLRQLDYQPRTRPRGAALGAGLAVAALAAGGGAYLAGAGPAAPGGTAAQAGQAIRLANYTFTLPAGFKPTKVPCVASLPPGVSGGTPVPAGRHFSAGAAAHGGCVDVVLVSPAGQLPSDGTPVRLGPDQGAEVTGPASKQVTLYVDVPGANGGQELVLAAKGLSQGSVLNMAARALGVPYGPAKG